MSDFITPTDCDVTEVGIGSLRCGLRYILPPQKKQRRFRDVSAGAGGIFYCYSVMGCLKRLGIISGYFK